MVRSNTTLVETTGPQLSPYGILSPAVTVKDLSNSSLAGFTYAIGDAGLVVENSVIAGGTSGSQIVVDNSTNRQNFGFYYPFDIQASIEASTFGTTPEALYESARNALELVAQKAIEAEFWHGHIAKALTAENDNRYLSNAAAFDVTPTAGTAIKVRYGQALLEEALGESTLGSKGVIHAPRLIASVLQTSDDNGALKTNLGTPVVAGAGYSNIGPSGTLAPSGQSWMYATGPVTVHVGDLVVTPDKVNQAVDTSNNTTKYYVDRPAAVTWSTTNLYAVLVDLTLDYQ